MKANQASYWKKKRPKVLAKTIYMVARLIGSTMKIEGVNFEKVRDLKGGKIYLGWHGRTFLATHFFRGKGVWTIISHSVDGEIQTGIFRRFGFNVIRGSSSKGGAKAALEAIQLLQDNKTIAFTPDGPRGPMGTVHDGVLMMAKKSGAWIVPAGVSASRRWFAPSWDRYMVPYPFSKGVIVFGEPFKIPENATEEELQSYKAKIRKSLDQLEVQAESMMNHTA